MQPTKKPRSVGPHKLKLKSTTYKKIPYIKIKKFRSTSTQLCRGSKEPNRYQTNLLQQHLFYTNKDLNTMYSLMPVSIPIVTCKFTKNFSHMISDRPLSSCSLYYRSHQRSKHHDKSSSIPIKDIELFYHLIGRLLFISNVTIPNIQIVLYPYSQRWNY